MPTRDNKGKFVKGVSGTQNCVICKLDVPLKLFSKGNNPRGLDYRCKPCEKKRRFKAYLENFERESFFRLRSRAKKQGIYFDLEVEDMPKLPTHCPILGLKLVSNMGGRQQNANSPTIDKIIPELGYRKGNIAWISSKANQLKSDATLDQVKSILKYMEEKICQ